MTANENHHVKVGYLQPEGPTAVVLDDVHDASFRAVTLQRGQGGAALFALRGVSGFSARDVRGMPDREVAERVDALTL